MGLVDLLEPSKALDEVADFPMTRDDLSLHLNSSPHRKPRFSLSIGQKEIALQPLEARYMALLIDGGYVTGLELFFASHSGDMTFQNVPVTIYDLKKKIGPGIIRGSKGKENPPFAYYIGDIRQHRRSVSNMVFFGGAALNSFTGCMELPDGTYTILTPLQTETAARIMRRKRHGSHIGTLIPLFQKSLDSPYARNRDNVVAYIYKLNQALGGRYFVNQGNGCYRFNSAPFPPASAERALLRSQEMPA